MNAVIALLALSLSAIAPQQSIYDSEHPYERPDGYTWNFAAIKGDVALIHVWSSTATDVNRPQQLKDLEASMRSPQFRVVHVCIDTDPTTWKAYINDHNWNYVNHIIAQTGMTDPLSQIIYQQSTDSNGITTYTATPDSYFLIDKDGIGHFITTGFDNTVITDAVQAEL